MSFMDNGGDYFTTAMSQLMHLPETIERMVFHPDDNDHDVKRRQGNGYENRRQRQKGSEDRGGVGSYPPVDVLETPESYVFYFDVPGLCRSDVQVAVEDEAMLLVRSGGAGAGKRKRDEVDNDGEQQQCKYVRLERRQLGATKFARKFRLPEDADAEAVTAKCEDGVLSVSVGKKRQAPEVGNNKRTVRIEIS